MFNENKDSAKPDADQDKFWTYLTWAAIAILILVALFALLFGSSQDDLGAHNEGSQDQAVVVQPQDVPPPSRNKFNM